MRILSKYVLREHLPPFLFAATALTLLLLLDQVSKRFGELVGKGLAWHTIAEVFVLSIPFILAMTLPMAVLIAVLYTFNRLAGDNEITAIKANGVHLPRVLLPLLGAGLLLAGGMVWFNNTVLPDSNHRLQKLLTEINRKKPTFSLQERTVNEVLPHELYLEAGRIDRSHGLLRDVAIYDHRDPSRPRTIYADSSHLSFSPDRTDLYLTLYDGMTLETKQSSPGSFQRIFFERQLMRVPDVTNRMQRDIGDTYRGDREMSIGQMQAEVDSARARLGRLQNTSQVFALALTRSLLGAEVAEDEQEYLSAVLPDSTVDAARDRPRSPADSGAAQAGAGAGSDSPEDAPDGGDGELAAEDGAPAAGAGTLGTGGGAPAGEDGAAAAGDGGAPPTLQELAASAFDISEVRMSLRAANEYRGPSAAATRFRTFANRLSSTLRRESRFQVEIQKKIAIPVACLVFILIGAPIAVRYPLGGVGMVVGVSFAFFCAYYVSLVGGEELADRLIVSPFWAMWAPNVLFGLIGGGLVWRAIKVG